jgi:hypothetical protein
MRRLRQGRARRGAENWVGFEKAVVKHRFLDEVFRASEEKKVGQI